MTLDHNPGSISGDDDYGVELDRRYCEQAVARIGPYAEALIAEGYTSEQALIAAAAYTLAQGKHPAPLTLVPRMIDLYHAHKRAEVSGCSHG